MQGLSSPYYENPLKSLISEDFLLALLLYHWHSSFQIYRPISRAPRKHSSACRSELLLLRGWRSWPSIVGTYTTPLWWWRRGSAMRSVWISSSTPQGIAACVSAPWQTRWRRAWIWCGKSIRCSPRRRKSFWKRCGNRLNHTQTESKKRETNAYQIMANLLPIMKVLKKQDV